MPCHRYGPVAAGLLIGLLTRAATAGPPPAPHFENDIEPLFARYGCNSAGCHGKADGQNGFKLSVFGFDPAADYAALVKEARGRRVFPSAPDASLLLRKASGQTAHGGGTRIPAGSDDYATLRGWIAAGMPVGDPNAPRVTAIRVEPAERVLPAKGTLQLRVVAAYSDGHEADVTRHARFHVNREGLAGVTAGGLVAVGETPGDVAVMAAYADRVELFRATIPRPGPAVESRKLPQFNFIDELVDRKLEKLNVSPSPVCDDADFLRRVSLDLIGMVPTPGEAREFFADGRPDRRAKWVDALLGRPEFADYQALKWADVLRVDRQALGPQRAYRYYRWIRSSFAGNKPFDQFARELVTAEGPLDEIGPANFFKAVPKPGEMAGTLSQVFLGVRIACAECHHHPYDRWGQADYVGMVAFFAPVAARGPVEAEAAFAQGNPGTIHPRTGEPVFAHALGEAMPAANPPGDRRLLLAAWMTGDKNPYFARNFANRIWAQMLGRGLVEPVDDGRATNPPTNPELLDALAKFATASGYDVRKMLALVAASRAYQTSSRPNDTNEKDEQNYSRALFKRLDAEVLLDAVNRATGVPERFNGMPAGTRAVQLWDSNVRNNFLKLFGRPVRTSACVCERVAEPSTGQVLNLLNSPAIQTKLSHEAGTVARLVRTEPDDGKLVDELYLTFFARFPAANERAFAVKHLAAKSVARRRAVEDLAWAMLNSLEFSFNH